MAEDEHLKLSRVDAVVALYERVPQIVDAEALEAFQRPIVKRQVVRVPASQSLQVLVYQRCAVC